MTARCTNMLPFKTIWGGEGNFSIIRIIASVVCSRHTGDGYYIGNLRNQAVTDSRQVTGAKLRGVKVCHTSAVLFLWGQLNSTSEPPHYEKSSVFSRSFSRTSLLGSDLQRVKVEIVDAYEKWEECGRRTPTFLQGQVEIHSRVCFGVVVLFFFSWTV